MLPRRVAFFGHRSLSGLHKERLVQAMREVLDDPWLPSANPAVSSFEEAMMVYLRRPDAVACSSGTGAIWVALITLGASTRDCELVTSDFTFPATIAPAVRLGMSVTTVDISRDTLLATEDQLAEACQKTRGRPVLVPVHIYGQRLDCRDARAIVRSRDGIIIDDAAHRISPDLPDEADAWCFSLGPTKNIMGVSEAGAVAFLDRRLGDQARIFLRNGNSGSMIHTIVGDNLQMDATAAAVLALHLQLLPGWDRRRHVIADMYEEALSPLVQEGKLQCVQQALSSAYHKFAVLTDERQDLSCHLGNRGIEVGTHYPLPLSLQPGFKHHVRPMGTNENASRVARRVLTLPIHPFVTDCDIEFVVSSIAHFYANRR